MLLQLKQNGIWQPCSEVSGPLMLTFSYETAISEWCVDVKTATKYVNDFRLNTQHDLRAGGAI